jgi:hypothetical protein
MTLFKCPTPDIEEKLVVDVHKLPPIPTPPAAINAPVEVEVDAVLPVTFKPNALKVFPRAETPERTYVGVLPIETLLLEPVR